MTAARATLVAFGDRTNAAHAGYLEARRLLLIGRLDEAEAVLDEVDVGVLPRSSRVGRELVMAGHGHPACQDRIGKSRSGAGEADS